MIDIVKKEKGITLIALVVTIIVLIILAGVSINMLVGDNGIITQAQKVKEETEIAKNEELTSLNTLDNELNSILNNVTESEKEVGISDLKTGDYIVYDSGKNGEIMCRILYEADSDYGLQIISSGSVEDVTLGEPKEDWENAREDYNNAITVLNQKAEEYLNDAYALDVRCVGSNPSDKNAENTTMEEIASAEYKGADENYIEDYNTLRTFESRGIGVEYWLASRYISLLGNEISIRYMYDFGSPTDGVLIDTGLFDNPEARSMSFGFRPCITLKNDIKIISGDGKSETTAYKMEKREPSSPEKIATTVTELQEGDYIQYDSGENGNILCRVLYTADSENGLQIISQNTVKQVILGGTTLDEAKQSHNAAIQTLNNEAMKYKNDTYALDARCVGSNPKNKNAEVTSIFENTGFKNTDYNYKEDWEQMKKLSNVAYIGKQYWLASRHIEDSAGTYIGVRYVHDSRELFLIGTANFVHNGAIYGDGQAERGLRPCITLKQELIITGGNGTKDNPYTLGT